jgi:sporulation protein YtfJ
MRVAEHPIQGLMKTAMSTLKEMVDVNTIVGEPVESQDGSVIVPISRVSFGFAAGGGEYSAGNGSSSTTSVSDEDEDRNGELPFAGGSGGGVTINPVGFLVVGQGTVRMMPVDSSAMMDRVLDMAPTLLREAAGLIGGMGSRRDRPRRSAEI